MSCLRRSTGRLAADELFATLNGAGAEVLYDDKDVGAGEKFVDAELVVRCV